MERLDSTEMILPDVDVLEKMSDEQLNNLGLTHAFVAGLKRTSSLTGKKRGAFNESNEQVAFPYPETKVRQTTATKTSPNEDDTIIIPDSR
jgi:hypothetical protein